MARNNTSGKNNNSKRSASGRTSSGRPSGNRASNNRSGKAEEPFAKGGRRGGRGQSQDRDQRGPKASGQQRRNRIPESRGDMSILEGKHALEEAIDTGAPIETLYMTQLALADSRMGRYAQLAQSAGAKLVTVTVEELDERSSHGAHQGIMAQLKPFKYVGVSSLIEAAAGKENALIIATDHVTDAGNFGAIARSAEIVGASGLLIPNKRNARVNTAAYKTSAGAVMHLPIAMEANLVRSLEALKKEGFWVVGASEHAEGVLWDTPLSGRVVLVMGSEGEGLSRLTLECCDMLVKLPQVGKVESLNVAQATTALAYEWMRQCSVDKS